MSQATAAACGCDAQARPKKAAGVKIGSEGGEALHGPGDARAESDPFGSIPTGHPVKMIAVENADAAARHQGGISTWDRRFNC